VGESIAPTTASLAGRSKQASRLSLLKFGTEQARKNETKQVPIPH